MKCNAIRVLAFIAAVLLGSSFVSGSEAPPNSDIVVFDLKHSKDGFSVSNPVIVASSSGYDNQPHFSADSKALFYTHIEKEQADIWQWDFDSQKSAIKISDPLSEFSPTLMPDEGGSLSMVRVEADGTQRLWKYSQKKEFSLLFDSIKPVGYHAWSGKNLGLFVLGEPHQLHVTRLNERTGTVVDSHIGRCLQKRPDHNAISYTVETNNNGNVGDSDSGDTASERIGSKSRIESNLKQYDFDRRLSSDILTLPSQDYVWYSANELISSDSEAILLVASISSANWNTIKNFSDFKLSGISRLALSPDRTKLAVVHQK